MTNMKHEALDIKAIISQMTDEERKQALALLQGMLIGKELAQKESA